MPRWTRGVLIMGKRNMKRKQSENEHYPSPQCLKIAMVSFYRQSGADQAAAPRLGQRQAPQEEAYLWAMTPWGLPMGISS